MSKTERLAKLSHNAPRRYIARFDLAIAGLPAPDEERTFARAARAVAGEPPRSVDRSPSRPDRQKTAWVLGVSERIGKNDHEVTSMTTNFSSMDHWPPRQGLSPRPGTYLSRRAAPRRSPTHQARIAAATLQRAD